MVLLEHLHQGPVSDTAKWFLASKVLVTKFISNATHKIGTSGTASGWKTTNNNPLGPIKLSSQSETGSSQ
jgi:hypothetical protein